MAFHVGQKVVRTRELAFPARGGGSPDIPAGSVVRVARIYRDSGIPGNGRAITLHEYGPENGYDADLFRPITFDFDALLATKPEDAPLVEMDMELEQRVRELNQVWSA